MANVRSSPWWGRLGVAWAFLLLVALFALAWAFRDLNVEAYKTIGWRQLAYNLPVIAAVFLMTKVLIKGHRWFAWKPSDLIFGRPQAGAPIGDSLLVKAMRTPLIGPFVTILLLMNLPVIAALEEFIFRNGTTDWRSAVGRSLLFGLAHLTANVPVGAALAISATGMWFSGWYFQGGLQAASAMHFGYILIVIGISAPAMLLKHFKR